MKSLFKATLFVLASSSLNAGQWSDYGTVSVIETYAGNTLRFQTTATHQDDQVTCGSGWYYVTDFTGLQQEQISMLLTAFAASQEIKVNVSGCGGKNGTDTAANYFNIKK